MQGKSLKQCRRAHSPCVPASDSQPQDRVAICQGQIQMFHQEVAKKRQVHFKRLWNNTKVVPF